MEKIDFKHPIYVLPAILFFPLLLLGWLVMDIIQKSDSEPSRETIPIERSLKLDEMERTFGEISDKYIEYDDSVKVETWESNYTEEELRNLPLAKSFGNIGMSETERRKDQSEITPDFLSDIKIWTCNAIEFFGDIFSKGAIRVYLLEKGESKDSINVK